MNERWTQAMQRLATKISPQNFDMWLRPIVCDEIDGHTLRLRVPNPYVQLWFESNYLDSVLGELAANSDNKDDTDANFDVEIRLDTNLAPPPGTEDFTSATCENSNLTHTPYMNEGKPKNPNPYEDYPDISDQSARDVAPQDALQEGIAKGHGSSNDGATTVPLNPRYLFDTFVSGPSNQLAFAAAQASANTYPPKYNPVFVCGGVGLGKTHLLHAIGHRILKTRPSSRLCYVSGERFMNEYVHAIQTHQMHAFRKRYRESYDVLLVDDVQFLAGKDGTQDEFFHTFNALHDSHRQIVLTADRHPHEISDIADRLRSRFAWGLLADIEPPELEVRMAILKKKAETESIHLPDEVSLYIATSIKNNVRELEGALIRLAAYASLSRREITLAFARETLEGAITRPPEHLTTDAVLKTVAGYYGLKIADLKSPRRHKSIAGPRAIAMYLARTHTKDSYPDLGRAFGGKHHTTVISAVEKITKRLQADNALRGEVNAIENALLR